MKHICISGKSMSILPLLLVFSVLLSGCSKNQTGQYLFANSSYQSSEIQSSETILLSHYRSATHPIHKAAVKFKNELEKATDHRYMVAIYPNNSLGDDESNLEALQSGAVELRISGNTGSILDILSWAPSFASISVEEISKHLVSADPLYQQIVEDYHSMGLHLLGIFEPGTNVLASNVPADSLYDFQGLNIRIAKDGDGAETTFWETLGAHPIFYKSDEVYTALQMGFIDAAEYPLGVNTNTLQNRQCYYLELEHRILFSTFYVSEEFWNTMEEDDQKVFSSIASDIIQNAFEHSSGNIRKSGTLEISDSDREVMRLTAGKAVRESLVEEYGERQIDKVEQLLDISR